jgi:putative ABC transport system permease protein
VSDKYFETMGIPLLKGRGIERADGHEATPVAVVNRALAEREWPGRDPIGEHLVLGGSPDDQKNWLRVVGVVADSRRASLQKVPLPAIYLSYQQFTLPYMGVVVRTNAGPGPVTSAVRTAVLAVDRDLPLGDTYTIEQIIERSTGDSRFRAFLVAVFAVVALVLATVGIYGLISYTVTERVPEIGVRLALGASPGQVGRLVVGQGLKLAVIGVGIGAAVALGVTRLLGSLLFAVSATEPFVYVGLTLLLLSIAAVASWVPARRAMKVDPMVALRAE